MTPDPDIERILESWLAPGASEMPDRLFDAVLERARRQPQRHRRRTLWRSTTMTPAFRFAAAAALALAIGLGTAPLWLPPASNVGSNDSPGPSPSSVAGSVMTDIPAAFQDAYWAGSYLPDPLADTGDFEVALSVSRSLVARLADPSLTLESDAGVTPDGRLRVETTSPNSGCTTGDVGLYAWSVTDGPRTPGTRLTIEPGTDDCAARAATLPNTYAPHHCSGGGDDCLGRIPAGNGESVYFEPRGPGGRSAYRTRLGALTFEVPEGWAYASSRDTEMSGAFTLMPDAAYASGQASQGPAPDQVSVWARPAALRSDADLCNPVVDTGVGRTVDDLVAWLVSHPALTSSEPQPITIGDYVGKMVDIDIAPTWTATCAEVKDAGPFVPLLTDPNWDNDPYWWGSGGTPGSTLDPMRLIFLDIGNGDTVAISIDSQDPAGLPALIDQAMPIVESFRFPS